MRKYVSEAYMSEVRWKSSSVLEGSENRGWTDGFQLSGESRYREAQSVKREGV
jgi:hypothetical protein